ncbi:hypothetical protein M0R04_13955 [Candidatus Dojkabacteria bacterium]|jgi:hypothetical protein|nr:hypothetical protein [Candidatus Dojkabacteria bacterium]
METIIKNDKVIDHPTHETFLEGCSTCFAENLLVHSKPNLCFCGKPARTPNSILCAECDYKSSNGIE